MVFVGLVIAIDSPRLFRDAFYYTALSYTRRYYRKVRGGAHKEIFPVAETIRRRCPENLQVATKPDKVAILHYLTGRQVIYPQGAKETKRKHAKEFRDFVAENKKVRIVVVDRRDGTKKYVKRLITVLDKKANLKRIRIFDSKGKEFKCERYLLYERIDPPPAGTTSPASQP